MCVLNVLRLTKECANTRFITLSINTPISYINRPISYIKTRDTRMTYINPPI